MIAWQGWEKPVLTLVLFSSIILEAPYRLRGIETCTDRRCEWVMPKFQKAMDYLPIESIDFTSAKCKNEAIDSSLIEGSLSTTKILFVNTLLRKRNMLSTKN